MAFRPYESSKSIVEFYKRYLLTTFKTNDGDYNRQLEEQLNDDAIYHGPFVRLTDPYRHTVTLADIINDGTVCEDMNNVNLFEPGRRLFAHQEEAVRKYRDGKNLIVTTGTGSGKTKTFMLSVIDQLLREKNQNGGELTPGVRILIIYPMNALVNDQMEEWEHVLGNNSGITFAHLTSETPKSRQAGDPASTSYIRYRDEIYSRPPHILVTNYAMLERCLLIPESGNLFENPNGNLWQTVILDEAHSYKGTLGIEISALLRRLRARVNREHFRFILTSATLGNNDSDIVNFGKILCSEDFDNDSIVRSESVSPVFPDESQMTTIPLSEYAEMADAIRNEDNWRLCGMLGIPAAAITSEAVGRALYNRLINDRWIKRTREAFINNDSNGIIGLTDASERIGITEDQLTNIITVASNAEADDQKLFEAKYHLFIKGIDGVFITLPPTKKLFLTKKTKYEENGEEYKVYQVSFCHKCGALFVCGQVINDGNGEYFVQKSFADDDYKPSVYRIDYTDDDDTDTLTVCAKCGAVRDVAHGFGCGHGNGFGYKLFCVKKDASRLHVCPCCGNRDTHNSITRPFVAGSDASTSVIGTALYNELPSYVTRHVHTVVRHPIYGDTENDNEVRDDRKKQLLVFSDNRQKAAKFADQFGDSYRDYLMKRLAYIVAYDEHRDELYADGISFSDFVGYLTDELVSRRVYDEDCLDKGITNIRSYCKSKATLFLINEMCGYRAKNSLMKKGGLYFSVNLNYPATTDRRTIDIFQMMLCQFMRYGAISADGLSGEDLDLFKSQNGINGYKRDGFELTSDCWKPNTVKGFKKYLVRVLDNEENADNWLNAMWADWSNSGSQNYLLKPQRGSSKNSQKVLATERIVIKPTRNLYCCSRCKNITPYNIDNICEKPGCDGQLTGYTPDTTDHYYKLYRDLDPYALNIREHTAQLSTQKAKDYQNRFTEQSGGINALSSTTTFEMGVNVGSLQTVFMRNVPPSPANYVQRSGRAGRSKESASFTLTFCPNSPHDRYYYRYPEKMIGGSINPPNFNIQNKEVLYRHIFAAVLSFFWKNNPAMYPETAPANRQPGVTNHRIGEFFGINGFDNLKAYIDGRDHDLTNYLLRAFPDEVIDRHIIANYEWVDRFYGSPEGLISRAKAAYDYEHDQLQDKWNYFDGLERKARNNKEREKYISCKMAVNKTITTLENQDIIGFLSRNTILPKYGFPTDIVTLKGTDTSVELDRGLALAISEYAPDSLVFADGKTYISRYVEIPYGYSLPTYFYRECRHCSALNRRQDRNLVPSICEQCGNTLYGDIKSYVIPKFGFRIEETDKKNDYAEKSYRSAVSYLGNPDGQQREYTYSLNEKPIRVWESRDDKLAVLNTKEIKICRRCGYATGDVFPSSHKAWFDRDSSAYCTCNETDTRTLGYELITDVAILDFVDCNITDINAAWSILYALLEGLSKSLNVERNDISGCLKMFGNRFGFVLFDTAPGGAGYVKKLVEDGNVIVNTFRDGFRIVYTCTCDRDTACYGCLCNYGNQAHHGILSRQYAIDFFENFATDPDDRWEITRNSVSTNSTTPPPTSNGADVLVRNMDEATDMGAAVEHLISYITDPADRNTLDVIRNNLADFDRHELPKLCGTVQWNETELSYSLLWEESKTVLFFQEDQESYDALRNNPDWNCFITDTDFDINRLIEKIRSN